MDDLPGVETMGAADEGGGGMFLSVGGGPKDLVAVGVGSYMSSCSISSAGDARTGAYPDLDGGEETGV
jgi:hypothetical protein